MLFCCLTDYTCREYERSLIKTEEELALERNTVIIPDEESAHILNLRSNCITIEHGPKTYIIKEGEEQVSNNN